jgi:hypothetical protein
LETFTILTGFTRELRGDTISNRFELAPIDSRFWGAWRRDLFVIAQAENSDIGGFSFNDVMLIPGIRAIRTRWNELVRPTEGPKIATEFRGSSTKIGSGTDYGQVHARSAFHVPLRRNVRLYLRGEVGVTAVAEFPELPASQRFFAGGDRSVRGFALNSLSPRGTFGVSGDPTAYTGRLSAQLIVSAGLDAPLAADVESALSGSASQVEFHQVQIRHGDGLLEGQARLEWQDAPSLHAQLHADRVDPALLTLAVSGRLALDLTVDGSWPPAAPRYALAVEALKGVLNGRPVRGRGRFESVVAGGVSSHVSLRIGDNTLGVKGIVGEQLDLLPVLEALTKTKGFKSAPCTYCHLVGAGLPANTACTA